MNRTGRRLALAAAAVLVAGTASAESNGGVRVMPLGDSITDGLNVPGGYRIGLWQRLVSGGYTVDFVVSQFNGAASLGDHDHEGHSGWTIQQIDARTAVHIARPDRPHRAGHDRVRGDHRPAVLQRRGGTDVRRGDPRGRAEHSGRGPARAPRRHVPRAHDRGPRPAPTSPPPTSPRPTSAPPAGACTSL